LVIDKYKYTISKAEQLANTDQDLLSEEERALSQKEQNYLIERRKHLMLYNDEPILEPAHDILNYAKYASTIADCINYNNYETAFAIGINGAWGTGKSSFINMLLNQIDTKESIKISFSPWNSVTSKDLIKDFFDTIQEALVPYHNSLPYLIFKYSNKLLNIHENSVTKLIKNVVVVATSPESINSIHTAINKILGEINKKLIIVIDDLDRLDKDEIIEVIRLIRNTANFRNTFFVVAYDRTYISKAIEKHNIHNTNLFLNKIFQIEITLPFYSSAVLMDKLIFQLESIFPRPGFSFRETFHGKGIKFDSTLVQSWLTSMRDVTRLTNSIAINFKHLIGEVDFYEFTLLEIVHLNFPEVYQLLYKRRDDFLVTQRSNAQRYSLKTNDRQNVKEYILLEYINNNLEKMSIEKQLAGRAFELVKALFSEPNSSINEKSNLSIVYPSKFERYFAYSLLNGSLSEVNFGKAREKSQKEFNSQIDIWVQDGLTQELVTRFSEITKFDDKEDYQKVITAIFYLASKEKKKEDQHRYIENKIVYFDADKILNHLSDYEDYTTSRFYNNNKEEFKLFVFNLFSDAQPPYLYQSYLANYINQKNISNLPLKTEELNKFLIMYLEEYCSKYKELETAEILYRNCVEYSDEHNKMKLAEADEIFKQYFMNTVLDDFIQSIIYHWSEHYEKYLISSRVKYFFGDYDTFAKEIQKLDNSKWHYTLEFLEFFLAFKKNDYKPIHFSFNIIPIQTIPLSTK
jgi:GTP-binding protein EngB required for normal cell division